MVIACDAHMEDHILDRGLHIEDARGIDSDQVMGLGQVIDGCRFGKFTKRIWRSLWYYKRF